MADGNSTWTYNFTFREVPSSGAAPYIATADFTLIAGAPNAEGNYTVLSSSGTIDGATITGLDSAHFEDNTLSLINTSFGNNVRMDGLDGEGVGFTLSDGRISIVDYVSFFNSLYAAVDVPRIRYPTTGKANVASFETTACYAHGTTIMTAAGEAAVQDLRIGDTVLIADGGIEPIRWIGRRSYDGRFIAGNHLMLPVTIRAGALADNIPHTDLVVSPGHAMWIDSQLVSAWRLINGVSVVQAEAVESVTYYHIELGRHAVILAEGAPAESFRDDDCRGQFENAKEFASLYPDAAPIAPLDTRLEDGFALQAIQERVAARAGVITTVEPFGSLRGFVDQAGPERVCGWAQDVDSPEEPVVLEVSADGIPVLCLLANAYRADLRATKMGSGCHAFDMALPSGLTGVVEIRRVTDGAVLAHTEASDIGSARRAA